MIFALRLGVAFAVGLLARGWSTRDRRMPVRADTNDFHSLDHLDRYLLPRGSQEALRCPIRRFSR